MILGPFSRSSSSGGTVRYQEVYKWQKDGRQRHRPTLPYYTYRIHGFGWGFILGDALSNFNVGIFDKLYARCYDRLHGNAIENRAELGLTLVEHHKAFQTIVSRSLQLVKAANAARKLDIKGFGQAFGVSNYAGSKTKSIGGKGVLKTPSNIWLEGNFFWKPFLEDIYKCTNILQQEFPAKVLNARAIDVNRGLDYNDGGSSLSNGLQVSQMKLRAQAKVTNPNLLLANQLGLTNPAFIAWDAVPFSFVVDWFLPVGAFLKSFSNEVGYSLVNRVSSKRVQFSGRVWHISEGFQNVSAYRVLRILPAPFPMPSFTSRVRVPELDPWKAATSVALVIQRLSSLK